VNLAFDVFARVKGKEFPLGSVTFRGSGIRGFGTHTLPIGGLRTVDLVLRSNDALARQTIDMNQIWQGELVLRDLPVQKPPPPAPR
jgi:hypothetical protein